MYKLLDNESSDLKATALMAKELRKLYIDITALSEIGPSN